ncbi:hypothetical protein BC830DRAFT_1135644 [Chytriomyces sp. MP71]|nr:hypothetical protein BC830DRAFT_1135644 [Chytriomyces sp. MP71]
MESTIIKRNLKSYICSRLSHLTQHHHFFLIGRSINKQPLRIWGYLPAVLDSLIWITYLRFITYVPAQQHGAPGLFPSHIQGATRIDWTDSAVSHFRIPPRLSRTRNLKIVPSHRKSIARATQPTTSVNFSANLTASSMRHMGRRNTRVCRSLGRQR